MTKGYIGSIERDTERNDAFRRVVATGEQMQLVLMTLMPGEEVGEEIHPRTDQFFRVESGDGTVVLGRRPIAITDGDAVLIPAGTLHNIVNRGKAPLRIYTLYAPPQHAPGTVENDPPQRRRI